MLRVWLAMYQTAQREITLAATEAEARTVFAARTEVAPVRVEDITGAVRLVLPALVDLARERDKTRDGTGRWRWRTVANVLKRWLNEPVDETCETCGQNWPTAA